MKNGLGRDQGNIIDGDIGTSFKNVKGKEKLALRECCALVVEEKTKNYNFAINENNFHYNYSMYFS